MFITFQIPLLDVRAFLSGAPGDLLQEKIWPFPSPAKDFIRSWGGYDRRRRGGIRYWHGEHLYCNAAHALRFQKGLLERMLMPGQVRVVPRYRRYYFDGTNVGRLEIGLITRLTKRAYSGSLRGPEELVAFIEQILSLETWVRIEKRNLTRCHLVNCGKYIIHSYLNATTQRGSEAIQPESWWASAGMPQLLIEFEEDEITAFPEHTRSFCVLDEGRGKGGTPNKSHEIKLHTFSMVSNNRFLHIWLMKQGYSDSVEIRREVRINLFRYHAERECLKAFLGHLAHGKLTPEEIGSDDLQTYLNDALEFVSKKNRKGLPQSEILEAVQRFNALLSEGEDTAIIRQLAKIGATTSSSSSAISRGRRPFPRGSSTITAHFR